MGTWNVQRVRVRRCRARRVVAVPRIGASGGAVRESPMAQGGRNRLVRGVAGHVSPFVAKRTP